MFGRKKPESKKPAPETKAATAPKPEPVKREAEKLRPRKNVTPTDREPALPEACPDCGYSPAQAAEFQALADTYDALTSPGGPYGGTKLPPAERERYGVLGLANRKWQACGQAGLHQQLARRAAGEGHDGEDDAPVDEEEGGDADAREGEEEDEE